MTRSIQPLNLHMFSRRQQRPLTAVVLAVVYSVVMMFTVSHSHAHHELNSKPHSFTTSLLASIQEVSLDDHLDWHSDQHNCSLCKIPSGGLPVSQQVVVDRFEAFFVSDPVAVLFFHQVTPTKRLTRAPPVGSV